MALFHRKLASHILFFKLFKNPFYVEAVFKSGSGTGSVMHSGVGFIKAKSDGFQFHITDYNTAITWYGTVPYHIIPYITDLVPYIK